MAHMEEPRAAQSLPSQAHLPGMDPDLREWFQQQWREPTPVQRLAWPLLIRGEHVLILAPTGTGKTLAALLPLWQRLHLNGSRNSPPTIQGLFIVPLKALGQDLWSKAQGYSQQLRLLSPERPWPAIEWRTGDTPPSQRQRQLQHPPDWLITTPESLSLLLAHPSAKAALSGVRSVVVDEVHALAPSKRGVELAVSLERLTAITAGEFQRVGLSATCSPRQVAADWLGGVGRRVETVCVPDRRPWDLRIVHLEDAAQPGHFLAALLPHLEPVLMGDGATLLFCEARSLAERVAWFLKRKFPSHAELVAVHHGSMACAHRQAVEHALQSGSARLVICSPSLELGVDLGAVDQVMMIRPPGGATRLLQRLGRAEHQPNGLRRGVIFTTTQEELWEAAAVCDAGRWSWMEPLQLPEQPLDVLCQQLVGMGIQQRFTPASALALLRRSYPYRHLTVPVLADCLDYLTGGRAAREYPARLQWQRHGYVVAQRRTARIYRQNVGSINSEPASPCRLPDGTWVGQLNSLYADRLEAGDRFVLGARNYEIHKRAEGQLIVTPSLGTPRFPRWQGGCLWMSMAMSERLWHLRSWLADLLLEDDAQALEQGRLELGLTEQQAARLIGQLREQLLVSEVPSQEGLIESWPAADGEGIWHAVHVPFPPIAADVFGRVLSLRIHQRTDGIVAPGFLGVVLRTEADGDARVDRWREWLAPEQWQRDLERIAWQHAALRTHFGDVARNGLMLLKKHPGPRPRVGGVNWAGDRLLRWLQFTQPQFPLVRQALKEVQEKAFGLTAVLRWLRGMERRVLRQHWLSEPSPLVRGWFDEAALQTTGSLADMLLHLHRQDEVAHVAT